ncbi:MAG: hypothetical protein U5N58_01010 [Actinomycetota bacterium]|nr:hypothetical protein [Actinomycetota bacterium]
MLPTVKLMEDLNKVYEVGLQEIKAGMPAKEANHLREAFKKNGLESVSQCRRIGPHGTGMDPEEEYLTWIRF